MIFPLLISDGFDYVGVSRVLTFSPGREEIIVQVPIINDNVHEKVQEFYATLTTTDSGVMIVETHSQATAVINDNDGRSFRI